MNETRPAPMDPEALARHAAQEATVLLQVPYLKVVTTQAHYDQNAAHIVALKAKGKDLEAKRTSITGPINASLKIINDLFRGPSEAIKQAVEVCEYPMRIFVREQDRIRKEAEAVAHKAAEEARAAQEAAVRAAEEEMARAREAEREATQAVAAAPNPFLAAAESAKAASAAGAAAEARATAEAAIREQHRLSATPIVSAVPQVKAAGTRINRPWKWEYDNKDLIPRAYLVPNEQLISATVRSLKGDARIPGIRAYEDISIGGR